LDFSLEYKACNGDLAKWQGGGLQNPYSAVRIRPSPPILDTEIIG
jgi:hypothetical protein